ncbi:unnamed protein product [Hydatigera taeniaeformis]|uniref:RT_RNaseH_2 domain-containing protein n=1 Tax=Hydatigena taeniaeformis TaxID=6205 RepID=A0A0R3WYN7_HYDTA|nr:unnamed protein product [Hydatigera taeniaeformis]
MTLVPKGCGSLHKSVTFLEHTNSDGGMAVTDDQPNRVSSWLTPTNQTELRSSLGLAHYYYYHRSMVKEVAKIAGPPCKVTESSTTTEFRGVNQHTEAFKVLKHTRCTPPILAVTNFETDAPPFVLDTDASHKNTAEHALFCASSHSTRKMRQKSST